MLDYGHLIHHTFAIYSTVLHNKPPKVPGTYPGGQNSTASSNPSIARVDQQGTLGNKDLGSLVLAPMMEEQ